MKTFLALIVLLIPSVASARITSLITLPAGSDGEIQVNDGVFGSSSTFTWNGSTVTAPRLSISTITFADGTILTSTASLSSGSGDIEGVTAGYGLEGGGTTGTVTLNLSSATTSYIQNTETLQSGATFYVSSGTVAGNLILRDPGNSGFGDVNGSIEFDVTDNGFDSGHVVTFSNDSVNIKPVVIRVKTDDGTEQYEWIIGENGQPFELSHKESTGSEFSYLILSDGGYTLINSSGTGNANSKNIATFAVYGSTPIGNPLAEFRGDNGASDGTGNVVETLYLQINHSSISAHIPLYVSSDVIDGDESSGTSGQVFTSNGSGSAPTWQNATVGSSTLAIATGSVTGFEGTISSPTVAVNFSSDHFKGQLTGSSTSFMELRDESVAVATNTVNDVPGDALLWVSRGGVTRLEAAVTDLVDLPDSTTYTYSITITSNTGGAGWEGKELPVMPGLYASTITISEIVAVSLPSGTTVLYQLEERPDTALNTTGTDVFTVTDSTANNTGVTTTSFNNDDLAPKSTLVLTTPSSGASSGSPTSMVIKVYWYKE